MRETGSPRAYTCDFSHLRGGSHSNALSVLQPRAVRRVVGRGGWNGMFRDRCGPPNASPLVSGCQAAGSKRHKRQCERLTDRIQNSGPPRALVGGIGCSTSLAPGAVLHTRSARGARDKSLRSLRSPAPDHGRGLVAQRARECSRRHSILACQHDKGDVTNDLRCVRCIEHTTFQCSQKYSRNPSTRVWNQCISACDAC